MLRRIFFAACALFLLASCGAAQGAPHFVQVFGLVDEPCATSSVTSRCTAHVYVVNQGGEGIAHATVVVPLRDATAPATSARTGRGAKCGKYIPDTPAGGAVDLTCNFDLPPGQTVASVPVLTAVDFEGSLGAPPSGGNTSGVATFAFAVIAALVALAVLAAAVTGRRRPGIASARTPDSSHEAPPDKEDDDSW